MIQQRFNRKALASRLGGLSLQVDELAELKIENQAKIWVRKTKECVDWTIIIEWSIAFNWSKHQVTATVDHPIQNHNRSIIIQSEHWKKV